MKFKKPKRFNPYHIKRVLFDFTPQFLNLLRMKTGYSCILLHWGGTHNPKGEPMVGNELYVYSLPIDLTKPDETLVMLNITQNQDEFVKWITDFNNINNEI